MANAVKSRVLLKTGTTSDWQKAAENNFTPLAGEVCIYLDRFTREEDGVQKAVPGIKIGDGTTPWNDFPYIDGKREVGNYLSVEDFPAIGDPTIIYKATKDKYIYQYNPETATYEKLNESFGLNDIEIIDGGNA